jgi:ABC-type multidrug transport system fused ATPase/permease subunit
MSSKSGWSLTVHPTLWFKSFLTYALRAGVTVLLPWMSLELVREIDYLVGTQNRPSHSWIVASLQPWLLLHPSLNRFFNAPTAGFWFLLSVTSLLFAVFAWMSRHAPSVTRQSSHLLIGKMRNKLAELLLDAQSSKIGSVAELCSRLTTELEVLAPSLESRAEFLFFTTPLILLLSFLTFSLEPLLLALCWLGGSLMFLAVLGPTRRLRVESRRAESASRFYENDIRNLLAALPLVKALSFENHVLSHLQRREASETNHILLAERSRTSIGAWTALLTWSARIAWVAIAIQMGRPMAESLVLGWFAIELSVMCGKTAARWLSEARVARPIVDRLEALMIDLATKAEIEGMQSTSSVPLPDSQVVRFENVSAHDNLGNSLELDEEFPMGEFIVLTGTNSARASIFGKLLSRLEEPASGKILIGRTDIRRYKMSLLRKLVTWIGRETFFVYGTVRDNLLLAAGNDSDPDDQRINEALHHSAVDFIGEWPERLETVIGEGGFALSLLESTKLNIARALLRPETRVFVFDQIAGDLDEESRETIFLNLRELSAKGALVFWTSRRLDEARRADRVLVFNDMNPVLIGSHLELLTHGPTYLRAFQGGQDEMAENLTKLEFLENISVDPRRNIDEKNVTPTTFSKDL